jgi:DNA-binding transcriptional MocR family regulator
LDQNLNLDLTRGQPSKEQLKLSEPMDQILKNKFNFDGEDLRNYGLIKGLDSTRKLGAILLGINYKNVIANGTSSLNLTSMVIQALFFKGINGAAWKDYKKISFLCPVPGYDRHFSLLEMMGINMINVPLKGDGPDMDYAEKLVKKDKSIKGIICVPKHSNPTGETYSLKVLERLAKLPKKASKDFMIFYDNAYSVHDFKRSKKLGNIFNFCKKSNTSDNIVMFASTSKITFAGAGISFLAASEKTLSNFLSFYQNTRVGSDKINQAKHSKFLKDKKSLKKHMDKHSLVLSKKFEIVENYLSKLPSDMADWTKPTGGYFVSFNSKPGKAKKIYKLCENAGLKLTPVGATFPYGKDPKNQNLRISPTKISNLELKKAMEVFITSVMLAG